MSITWTSFSYEYLFHPDTEEQQIEKAANDFIKKLKQNAECKFKIFYDTFGLHVNPTWQEIRKNLISTSYFSKIIKTKSTTHCHELVKTLLYGKSR